VSAYPTAKRLRAAIAAEDASTGCASCCHAYAAVPEDELVGSEPVTEFVALVAAPLSFSKLVNQDELPPWWWP